MSKRNIKEILRKLKEYKDAINCTDFCIDCLVLVKDDITEHWKKKHTVIHQCYEHGGIDEWINCINWLIKNGYISEE